MKIINIIALICLTLPLYGADEQPANGGRKVEKPVNFIPAQADPLMGDWQGGGGMVAQVVPTTEG